ncbi:MAG: hypothetical protein JWO77_3554 [Ilumatobacteraceae bacterium]|nr:hypothetical protein [Ilumatobacteraceae bacterium]
MSKSSIAKRLRIYEKLLSLLVPGEGPVEWPIIERRFLLAHPDEYQELLGEFGHTTYGPRRYSVSSYLARRMGTLAGQGKVEFQYGEATGRWSYLGRISYWSLPGTPTSAPASTWEQYAKDNNLPPHWRDVIDGEAA